MIERISFRMRTNKTKNANINQLIVYLGIISFLGPLVNVKWLSQDTQIYYEK